MRVRDPRRKADDDEIKAIVQALGHPVRRRILRIARETDVPVSPTMAADQLEALLPNVAYHFRVLGGANLLHLVKTRLASGSVEHLYLPNPKVITHPVVQEALSASE